MTNTRVVKGLKVFLSVLLLVQPIMGCSKPASDEEKKVDNGSLVRGVFERLIRPLHYPVASV